LSSVEELCWWLYCRREMSAYNLKYADVGRLQQRFELYDAEAQSLLSQNLAIPA
jgi:glycyl-tRNA synthetase alpha subunit